jgi:SAM-dependent methyltransferase
MSSYTRQQLEDWLKTIEVPSGSRVLDIGGSQLPILERIKIGGGKGSTEFKILDLEQPHKCKRKPDIVCDIQESIPCNVAVQHYSLNENKFDIIFCIEVSEYWHDPLSAISNMRFMIKKGGILYISFHFLYPHHNPKGEDCLRYTRWGVEKLLKETGFKIEEIKHRIVKDRGLLFEFYTGEGMRPTKEYEKHSDVGYLVKAIKL